MWTGSLSASASVQILISARPGLSLSLRHQRTISQVHEMFHLNIRGTAASAPILMGRTWLSFLRL